MALTAKNVEYVAHLARLELNEEEKERFASQLDGILEYVDKLNALVTDEVQPLVHLSESTNVFRNDEVSGSLSRKEALQNAPGQAEGAFKVPSIID